MSWVDEERDCSSWLGNVLQQEAFRTINEIGARVRLSQTRRIRQDWYYLQSSDHFYYMSTKFFSNGANKAYVSPYVTPYEAFINYMNVLSDFAQRLKHAMPGYMADAEVGQLNSAIADKDAKIAKLEAELVKAGVAAKPAKARTPRKKAADDEKAPKKETKSIAKTKKSKQE